MKYEIIVVGGGMAGLSCALGLAQEGFKVAVIEVKKLVKFFDVRNPIKRVSAINHASQTLLKRMDVWQNICDVRTNDYVAMRVWDQNSNANLYLQAIEFSMMKLGTIVENDLIVAMLYQKLSALGIDIFEETDIDEISQINRQNILQSADGKILKSELIIGADGANSLIRQKKDFICTHIPYGQHAIVANVKTQKRHKNTAYQRFLRDGVLALLPLCEPDLCSIVYSINTERLSSILAMNDEVFSEHLNIASEGVLGEVQVQSPRVSFELIERHAEHYYKPGIVLIADAAHTIHPLAGQGINLGFADVQVLISVLVETRQLRRDISDISTLAQYAKKRRFENQLMIDMMRGLKTLFCNDNIWFKPLRAYGMNTINSSQWLKRFFVERAMGYIDN